ncbi:BMC domain-containing protein [Brevibacillus borstelensis]|uniref:BMC domain-containing protein n=1 Tax=Brevibacillus borstelensis TaxID=45462 RepID=UPI002E23413F|nr:BMC domain-containing protein [Brevibacillus borstelensis]MED2008732.1 BMC domain-containing protein [Brevibacillus borstelensis]
MLSGGYALGMIETVGFPALVAAADAAAKAADVHCVTYQGADAGIVTIYIVGDVASVSAAVTVGEAEARRIGQLRHSQVIPRPDQTVLQMVFQRLDKKKGPAGAKPAGRSTSKETADKQNNAKKENPNETGKEE